MSKASEEAKESRLWQPVTVKWFAVLCGVALGYAILRYHLVQGVEWSHFPLFILNKAVSLAAVLSWPARTWSGGCSGGTTTTPESA